MRRHPLILVLAILASACGGETSLVERLVASAAPPAPAPRPTPTAEPPPPPSASSLTVAGDIRVEDQHPDVAVATLPAEQGREPRLRLEVRHRLGGSSQPDTVLAFLNVPARPGTYPLHSPEDPMLPGRVYAILTTRGEALGSMKDFNSAVAGTLTLRREGDALAGSFRVSAQEPLPPPTPVPLAGRTPVPQVGTVPPEPPGRVDASGTLLAELPAGAASDSALVPNAGG